MVGCSWPQHGFPFCLPVLLWPHLDKALDILLLHVSYVHIIWQNLDAMLSTVMQSLMKDLILCSSSFQSPEAYITQKRAKAGNHLRSLITHYGFISIVRNAPFFKKPPSTSSLPAIDSTDENNNLHLTAVNSWMSNSELENVTDLHSQAGLWTEMYVLSLHPWFPAGNLQNSLLI